MASLPLLPQVFSILAGLVEDRAGLHYRADDLELLRDKVSPRAEMLGFDSLLDYYYFLRYDPQGAAEQEALIEALVVHETYFYREADQLEAYVGQLLPRALGEGGTARIWCAAAATGEEPLTLAMMLADRGLLGRVQIVASDISDRALQRARRGEFSGRSLRALPKELGKWFDRRGEAVVVDRKLVDCIDWRRLNLIDRPAVEALGHFSAVLCRNVLIYFSDQTARTVVASLTASLEPRGFLLVGASESLMRYGTSLSCDECGGAFFYRRVA